jgi:hypothetical protein
VGKLQRPKRWGNTGMRGHGLRARDRVRAFAQIWMQAGRASIQLSMPTVYYTPPLSHLAFILQQAEGYGVGYCEGECPEIESRSVKAKVHTHIGFAGGACGAHSKETKREARPPPRLKAGNWAGVRGCFSLNLCMQRRCECMCAVHMG